MANTGARAKTTTIRVACSGPLPAHRAAAHEQASVIREFDPSADVAVVQRRGSFVLRVRSWS